MIRGITFNLQSMKSEDHAYETNFYYRGLTGVTKGCEVTENVSGNLEVSEGYFIIGGRLVNIQSAEEVTVPSVASGTLYSILVFTIDLTQVNTASEFNQGYFEIVSDAADYPSLTQEDLNDGGTVYQFEFARFENTVSGIGFLSDTNRVVIDMDAYVTPSELNTKAPLASPEFTGNIPKTNGESMISNSSSIGTDVLYVWSGTQAQYDDIGTKDGNTLYFIV